MELPGFPDPSIRDYEIRHGDLSRRAAAEGMVLLKNENHLLPLKKGEKADLYGPGAIVTVRGGTGSGSVNARETVSVRRGLEEGGIHLCNGKWLDNYEKLYQASRAQWKDAFWDTMDVLRTRNPEGDYGQQFFEAYNGTVFVMPQGEAPEKSEADLAVYVLSRTSGEGGDRRNASGDYLLSEQEKAFLTRLNDLYPDIILLLNVGGVMDLSFLDPFTHIRSVLLICQPGGQAGRAVSDVLTGRVNPSGKLTDSWAYHYADYPGSAVFSDQDGDVKEEPYPEGIFVGYRYFDTFEKAVRYGFGYGLSYTEFALSTKNVEASDEGIDVVVEVTNTGRVSGRDVVQIYASVPCPQEEYRRLAGYQKTKLLQPEETERVTIHLPKERFERYDEASASWVIDAGDILLFVGDSLEGSSLQARVRLSGSVVLEQLKNLFVSKTKAEEIEPPRQRRQQRRQEAISSFAGSSYSGNDVEWNISVSTHTVVYDRGYEAVPEEIRRTVHDLSDQQLIHLVTGMPKDDDEADVYSSVPGAAGFSSCCAEEQGIASLSMADGPAGLRLSKKFQIVDGKAVKTGMAQNMDDGVLDRDGKPENAEERYQFCTAFPIGTLLASSWDPELVQEVGIAVGEEMQLFHVQLWLAPGMNIHRNPLCGRNFEYYSEDPLLSGMTAAAVTRGVQSLPGCGTTIKHFACNNQENNRFHYNAMVSEHALREVYLKGFELAVRESQPAAIMTSYNKINGIHAANSYNLCMNAARCEWGFEGLIMTDWTTTWNDPECTAHEAMRAGNDLLMPGCRQDLDDLASHLKDGSMDRQDLERSAGHIAAAAQHLKKGK